jgi:hypothetical protein
VAGEPPAGRDGGEQRAGCGLGGVLTSSSRGQGRQRRYHDKEFRGGRRC